mgnify:CR=1 FL=1|tara:strand:+ start:4145 stop:4540 length:396 start_codon:yes stop_codon:yes gene_type:complete
MDKIIKTELKKIQYIASSNTDYPLLMINQNKYVNEEYPSGLIYKKWKSINIKMITDVEGKIIWTFHIKGQILVNGYHQKIDEILGYWYPSHLAFMKLLESPDRHESFKLRKRLITNSIIHICDGRNTPKIF